MTQTLVKLFILFAEPGFPIVDADPHLADIPNAIVTRSVTELQAALIPGRTLLWRHGSAFPLQAWPAIEQFLERGGSLVYLGGEPFTRPVGGPVGQRRIEPRTVAFLKALRLNQSTRLNVGGHDVHYLDGSVEYRLEADAWVSILQPRLSDTRDFAHEDGTPGARDGICTPLAHITAPNEDAGFPQAAASLKITRLRGRFAGGQWVFRLLSTPPVGTELNYLLEQASAPAVDFRVDPTFGCFHDGEEPSVVIRLHRPLAHDVTQHRITMVVNGPNEVSKQFAAQLQGGRHASSRVPLTGITDPGLYTVTAEGPGLPSVTTGFWVFDPVLFASGSELSFDDHTLLRDGRPEPVVGTTVMSRSVHRKFLFEPNAAEWDRTFRELSELKINLVRTGVWSAYRKVGLDPHVVDEAWLRALEAFYLSARRHGIPVMFTFFAFVPESFGGTNPYLDPRAIEGQRAYLSAVAERFSSAREILWDLINEPSFSSPDKLWQCRPHGDVHEELAFARWLEARFETTDMPWQDLVRMRWRLRPNEAIALPTDTDFEDFNLFGNHRPYRAKDYVHFAQDAFTTWIMEMTAAIRHAGSQAAITVGQDEGGLFERPNPLHHGHAVDYTSIHTWWFNDALLWDAVMAKAAGRALLVSETGIMGREWLSGEDFRDPSSSAALLSRKLAYAFAARGFGAVQWCYHVNPYMDSDNEVSIGLVRADGSYKPEYKVLADFAAFVQRNKDRFTAPPRPEVALVLPYADHVGPRGLQKGGTQRALSLLMDDLGLAVQVVAESRLTEDLGSPKLIVLPACRGLHSGAWQAIETAVRKGAVLLCSGWFEADDAGLPAARLDSKPRRLFAREPFAPLDGANAAVVLEYDLEVIQSAQATDRETLVETRASGSGQVMHVAVPLEWARDDAVQRKIYNRAARLSQVTPKPPPARGVYRVPLGDDTLIVAVNESARDMTVILGIGPDAQTAPRIPAGHARLFVVDRSGRIVDQTP